MEEMLKEIAEVEEEMRQLYDEAMVSDLANEKYKELEQELRKLKKVLKSEKVHGGLAERRMQQLAKL